VRSVSIIFLTSDPAASQSPDGLRSLIIFVALQKLIVSHVTLHLKFLQSV
jgi:hypothetical protein